MRRLPSSFLFALFVCALPAAGFADLPSLLPKDANGDPRRADDSPTASDKSSAFSRLRSIGRGSLYFDAFGMVDYRLSGRGLKTFFHYAGASGGAMLGYDGKGRLELAWSVEGGGRLKLSVGEEDGRGKLWLEFEYGPSAPRSRSAALDELRKALLE